MLVIHSINNWSPLTYGNNNWQKKLTSSCELIFSVLWNQQKIFQMIFCQDTKIHLKLIIWKKRNPARIRTLERHHTILFWLLITRDKIQTSISTRSVLAQDWWQNKEIFGDLQSYSRVFFISGFMIYPSDNFLILRSYFSRFLFLRFFWLSEFLVLNGFV